MKDKLCIREQVEIILTTPHENKKTTVRDDSISIDVGSFIKIISTPGERGDK